MATQNNQALQSPCQTNETTIDMNVLFSNYWWLPIQVDICYILYYHGLLFVEDQQLTISILCTKFLIIE